jgi:hypothetical protein
VIVDVGARVGPVEPVEVDAEPRRLHEATAVEIGDAIASAQDHAPEPRPALASIVPFHRIDRQMLMMVPMAKHAEPAR